MSGLGPETCSPDAVSLLEQLSLLETITACIRLLPLPCGSSGVSETGQEAAQCKHVRRGCMCCDLAPTALCSPSLRSEIPGTHLFLKSCSLVHCRPQPTAIASASPHNTYPYRAVHCYLHPSRYTSAQAVHSYLQPRLRSCDLRYAPVLEQLLPDGMAGHSLTLALHRDAHQVCARVRTALDLLHRGSHIPSVCGGHGLHREADQSQSPSLVLGALKDLSGVGFP